jgi:hypothetical protein
VVGTQNTEKAKEREITLKYIQFAEVGPAHKYMYTRLVVIHTVTVASNLHGFMNNCMFLD